MSFSEKMARPGQTLAQHLLEVSRHASYCGSKINMGIAGEILGLIHDWGKVSQAFQDYLESQSGDHPQKKGSVDHATAGGQFLWHHCHSDQLELKAVKQLLTLCSFSHHNGGLIDSLTPSGENNMLKRLEKPSAETHYDELEADIPFELQEKIRILFESTPFREEVRQFSAKAAGKGSTIYLFYWNLLSRFLFSSLVEADQISAAGEFDKTPSRPDWSGMLDRLNAHIDSFQSSPQTPVNILRQEISDLCLQNAAREQGQFLLTLPTGGGKTLASLRFALAHAQKHDLDRIVYVIPYTSIIEQNVKAARRALEDEAGNLVLEHHSNLIPDKDDDDYKRAIQSWDAPIVFTTSVQFLNALFSSGASHARRMNSLARSVLIFDEIQTLPLHSIHLFNNAVNFLTDIGGSTTVFCTATQPTLSHVDTKKGALQLDGDRPHIVPNYLHYFHEFSRYRELAFSPRLKDGGWSLEELAELVKTEADHGNSVLFIVNTKKLAHRLFSACRVEGYEVHHLSTYMCPAHRSSIIESEIGKDSLREKKKAGKKVICITTQLIEAGVDVDFDIVIRSSAGLDSVTQAAGRCNRDGLSASGKVILVNPEPELEYLQSSSLETIKKGKEKTEQILREYNQSPEEFDHQPLGEKILLRYFEYFYELFRNKMSYTVPVEHLNTTLLDLLSTNDIPKKNADRLAPDRLENFPLPQSFESAAQAYKVIDQDNIGVLVPYGRGKAIIDELSKLKHPSSKDDWIRIKALLKEGQRYSVSFFTNCLEGFKKYGYFNQYFYHLSDAFDVLCLSEGYYDQHLGFLQPEKDFRTYNPESFLS